MSESYMIYDSSTGRILGGGEKDDVFTPKPVGDEKLLLRDHKDPNAFYYDENANEFVERAVLSFDKTEINADDTDTATLDGLPDPCTVLIDDEEYEVSGGKLELTADVPATYQVHVRDRDAFPAQELKAEITAV